MPAAVSDASADASLTAWQDGVWRLRFGARSILAGVTDRSCSVEELRAKLADSAPAGLVLAEQVHGASIASIETPTAVAAPVPGCDGLLTQIPGLALVVRSADCLPVFAIDARKEVVGAVHAGWRGLAKGMVASLIDALAARYHSRRQDLWIGIGPAIRSCCYDVGPELDAPFSRFVRTGGGRRICDLVGFAVDQAVSLGVPAAHVVDCRACTACDPVRWHSVRRDGERAGRLLSFICIAP